MHCVNVIRYCAPYNDFFCLRYCALSERYKVLCLSLLKCALCALCESLSWNVHYVKHYCFSHHRAFPPVTLSFLSSSLKQKDIVSTHHCALHKTLWQLPLKLLHPLNPLNPETQIPRYNFQLNQNLHLNWYREIPRNESFSIWWILGM